MALATASMGHDQGHLKRSIASAGNGATTRVAPTSSSGRHQVAASAFAAVATVSTSEMMFFRTELFCDGNFDAGITGRGKEIGHGDVQYLGNFIEPATAHPVGSLFIFLHLLKRDTELLS